MTRIDEDTLSLHLEVALAVARPTLLNRLNDCDVRRRSAAVTDLARHLTERLRCFEIRSEEQATRPSQQPSLFSSDPGAMG